MKPDKIVILFIIIGIGISGFLGADFIQTKNDWDGNRTSPVHIIPLKDELDEKIIPTESYPLPYSTRFSCAPCHDYEDIRQGLHFNSVSADQPGRPGEPWIWMDPETGTVLPVSYRKWQGVWNPQDLGLSFWDFTLLFGRHMTGGSVTEPDLENMSPESRWDVSGKLEINCMGCHSVSRLQSHSEWAVQVLRQNFRWAATAASGLGEVGGMAFRLPPTWDIIDGPNPDDTEYAVVPSVRYDRSCFDSDHNVFFEIAYKPEDERCLVCHSVSQAGMKQFEADGDIHTSAGIKCVSCHRNDLSHTMIRGYEGEAEEFHKPGISEFTCQGCHIGNDLSRRGAPAAGRLGAPYPLHKGLPAVHFERLSCTVCHSGPLPEKEPVRIRTSRANRLGIYGIAQWMTELPHIVEPVYFRDSGGKLSPNRLMWPAFWGEKEGENIRPLKPAEVQAAAGEILEVEKKITSILAAFSTISDIDGIPVMAREGKLYKLNIDGGLDVSLYSGEKTRPDELWAVEKESKAYPLIPDFDPDAEEPDIDLEILIQNILAALGTLEDTPGKPVVLNKNSLYFIREGYLEKKDWQGKAIEHPYLHWFDDEEIYPLVSEFALRTVVATTGYEQTLTEEQVRLILKALSAGEEGQGSSVKKEYFYVSGGRMFLLDEKAELKSKKNAAAEPVVWPLAHQVRPAQQSLGINGCQDCHSLGSDFFFSLVQGTGPLQTKQVASRSGNSFMGLDMPYQKLFGLSFTVRPLLKIVLFIAGLIIAILLLFVGVRALVRVSRLDRR